LGTDGDDWTDTEGDGCEYYKEAGACSTYGNDYGSPLTANLVCCSCGGGSTGPNKNGCM